jgi:tetratricopeptide (TPR) repeat protein/predicted Ser/Thr protein kinase
VPKYQQCPQCFKLNDQDSQFCSKCGSSLDKSAHTLTFGSDEEQTTDFTTQLQTGILFDNRYRIIEEIGRGGMGRVYKAEDTKLNITVALKLIRPKYAADPAFIERFKQETLTARSISHENVIRIHDLGETKHNKYLTMEYISGRSLREIIQSTGRINIERTIDLTRQMCEALNAAHRRGIVHMDLKPSNIMVDNSGQAHIMDFGLARAIYVAGSEKNQGITGTPRYMSPEQAQGERADSRSDIYSLGALLYEMATGAPVFDGKSHQELMTKQIQEIPKAPSKLNPQIPPFLENIICRCLEKNPAKRFQNTMEILQDLEKHKPKSKNAGFFRWVRRPLIRILASIIIIAAAFFVYFLNKSPSSSGDTAQRKTLAILYLQNNTGNGELDHLEKSLTELMISDLFQSKYIRVMSADKIYYALYTLDLLDKEQYSTEDLKNIAASCNAEYVLAGSFSGTHDSLLIDTNLYNSKTMEVVGQQRARGRSGDGIFTLVDTMSREIKEDFNLTPQQISQDIDKDVILITTDSPEALQHFVAGKILSNLGKFEDSNKEFQQAVDLDPEFANAYRMMYINCNYLGQYEEADKNLARAQSLLNRVSERDYYLIQALLAPSYETTIDNYEKLLEIYPDDLETLGFLGSMYRNREEWELAKEQFEKIIEIDPSQENTLINIAYLSMTQGLYEEAKEILISHEDIFTNKSYYHSFLGMIYLCQQKFDLAIEQAELAISAGDEGNDALLLMALTLFLKNDFDSAEKTFKQMIASDDFYTQFRGLNWLYFLYLTTKNEEKMIHTLSQGLEFSKKYDFMPGLYNFNLMQTYTCLIKNDLTKALESASKTVETALLSNISEDINFSQHLRGLIYIKLNRLEEARAAAENLKQRIEKSGLTKHLRHYHHLKGEIALAEDDSDTAIAEFKTACSLLPAEHSRSDMHILYYDSLASAYYEKGQYDKALKEYERIVNLTTGRLRWGDKYGHAFYRLGEIYSHNGDEKKVAENFNEFVNIWKSADPKHEKEIENARQKLEKLKAAEQLN